MASTLDAASLPAGVAGFVCSGVCPSATVCISVSSGTTDFMEGDFLTLVFFDDLAPSALAWILDVSPVCSRVDVGMTVAADGSFWLSRGAVSVCCDFPSGWTVLAASLVRSSVLVSFWILVRLLEMFVLSDAVL